MPTYDYQCAGCGHELELFQNISEAPKKKCPACKKSRLKRKIGGGAGFLFKGSGFYLTDYRSDSYKKAAEADSKSTDSKGAGADSTAAGKKSGKGEQKKAEPKSEQPPSSTPKAKKKE